MTKELTIAREPDTFGRPQDAEKVFYAVHTTWWTTDPSDLYKKDSGLPCDPRGSVLFETDNVDGFFRAAEENADHYGRHGLRAFMAARHGVIVAPNGNPTSIKTWDQVNHLIDAHDAARGESS